MRPPLLRTSARLIATVALCAVTAGCATGSSVRAPDSSVVDPPASRVPGQRPATAALEDERASEAAATVIAVDRLWKAGPAYIQGARLTLARRGRFPQLGPSAPTAETWPDGYIAWVAVALVRRASDGQLFEDRGGVLYLRHSLELGDGAFWYYVRLRAVGAADGAAQTWGPFPIWSAYLGIGEEATEYERNLALPGLPDQGVVELDLLRVARYQSDEFTIRHRQEYLTNRGAHLCLRVSVPVVASRRRLPGGETR